MDYNKAYGPTHNDSSSGWWPFAENLLKTDQGIYRILLNVSISAAGIALLAAVLLLAISAGGGTSSKTFQEAKGWVVRIIIISILIFAVTGLITLIGTMGLD